MPQLTTPEAVENATGKPVTLDDVAIAQSLVGLVTGVDLDADTLPYRRADLRALTAAIIWQAPFVHANPDLLESAAANEAIVSASTNGNSISYGAARTPEQLLLSPLARMALTRLSWRRSSSVTMIPTRPRTCVAQTLTNDGADGAWKPLR